MDANIFCGRKFVHLESGDENGFLPLPSEEIQTDIIYICSPNNPTGAAYDRKKLREWVDYANRNATVLLYV